MLPVREEGDLKRARPPEVGVGGVGAGVVVALERGGGECGGVVVGEGGGEHPGAAPVERGVRPGVVLDESTAAHESGVSGLMGVTARKTEATAEW